MAKISLVTIVEKLQCVKDVFRIKWKKLGYCKPVANVAS